MATKKSTPITKSKLPSSPAAKVSAAKKVAKRDVGTKITRPKVSASKSKLEVAEKVGALTNKNTTNPASRKGGLGESISKIKAGAKENFNAIDPTNSLFNTPPSSGAAEKNLKDNLAKQPSASLLSSLRIFQIYYEPWQRELLDPHFVPLDNGKSRSELLEFAVFEQLLESKYVKGASLWGALSWRFSEKTGMNGADWIKSIGASPGYDVYYCDPNPQNEALFHNLWMQGETSHPEFLAISRAVFQAAGLSIDDLIAVLPSDKYSSTNCFVATPQFWAAYLPWVKKVLALANKKLPPKVRDLLHSAHADDRGLHKGATYVPFIVERLFPIFMKTAGKQFKGFKIALPERERELNVHLKLLREMKDLAHRTKSVWLVACWVNYRNLYLTQAQKKDWCTKYLAALNPVEIKFS
jgi:hypothetical protein